MNTRQNETESRVEQKIVVAINKEIQPLHLRVIIQIKIRGTGCYENEDPIKQKTVEIINTS